MAPKANREKAHFVHVDPPYLLYPDRIYDTFDYCVGARGAHVEPEKQLEFLVDQVLQAALKCARSDSYIFMWVRDDMIPFAKAFANSLQLPFSQLNISRKPSSASQAQNQTLPVYSTEYAIMIQKGTPNWTTYKKYGEVYEEGNYPKNLPNFFNGKNRAFMGSAHPFMKPPTFIREIFHYYVPKGGLIIDGFAGSCSTMFGAVSCEANLICVEKDISQNKNLLSFQNNAKKVYNLINHKIGKELYSLKMAIETEADLTPKEWVKKFFFYYPEIVIIINNFRLLIKSLAFLTDCLREKKMIFSLSMILKTLFKAPLILHFHP